MLKLLIVDDEPGVCDLLNRLIDWEGHRLTCIGFAGNGIEAHEMIRLHKPDIVITDIQLPGMTGLELIERVHGPDSPNFIVISGYREFEYAQKALKFSVEDYLLKPICRDDLNLVLEKLVKKLRIRLMEETNQQNLLHEHNERTAALRNNELKRLIREPSYQLNPDYFHFQKGEYFILALHVSFQNPADISCHASEIILDNVCSRMMKHLKRDCFDLEKVLFPPYAYLLVNHASQDDKSYREKKEILQNILQETNIQYEHARMALALGRPATGPDLEHSVRSAQACLALRLAYGCQSVIDWTKLDGLADDADYDFSEKDTQELVKAILALKSDDVIAAVNNLLSHYQQARYRSICQLYDRVGRLIDNLGNELETLGFIEKETRAPHPVCAPDLAVKIDNCNSVSELKELLINTLQKEISYCVELRNSRGSEPVFIAKEFVHKNIDKQISLEEVASLVHVCPSYFSALFKKKTGMTFSDYLIEAKIEAAKNLLKNSQLNINEIASCVGYTDARHFSKVFCKKLGVKPVVYRRFYA